MGRWVVLLILALILERGLFSWHVTSPVESASIVNSWHNLSLVAKSHQSVGYEGQFNDYNEVCVYCHTPHHASTVQKPLWNRPETTAVFQVYESSTMDAVPGQPGPTSRLCLSCHDGTIAVDRILNVPNAPYVALGLSYGHGRMVYPGEQLGDCGSCHPGSDCDSCHGMWDFTNSFLGTDLRNDHPVAVSYPTTPDFVPLPPGGVFPNGIRLVDGQIECVTCHEVHDPGIKPFLRTSNTRSALCLTCHVK